MNRLLIAVIALSSIALSQDLVLGTGGVTGVYFPVGGTIAEIVGDVSVVTTDGSVHNVMAIQKGEYALALAQSDVVYQAYQGEQGLEQIGLRSLMGLHPEPTHLLCDSEARVTSFREIAGKRVSIGHPGSGILHTVRIMLEVFGMSEADFSPALLDPGSAFEALKAKEIDCLFAIVGIGSPAVGELLGSGSTNLIGLDDPELDALIESKPYYAYATVPANSYPGQPEEITLFGVKALLVADEELLEVTAYRIVQAILMNLDSLLDSHPALAGIVEEDLLKGLGAPLHPGAERAYREAGLL